MSSTVANNGRVTGTPPPGIPFVFDTGVKKVEEQLASVDSLDLKMGVLVALNGAFIAALLAALFASDPSKLAPALGDGSKVMLALDVIFCLASIYYAFQAFRLRTFYDGIQIAELAGWSNEEVPAIKEAFLPTLLLTIEGNRRIYGKKVRSAGLATLFAFLMLASLLATVVMVSAELFRKR